jgi:hypothetical protein
LQALSSFFETHLLRDEVALTRNLSVEPLTGVGFRHTSPLGLSTYKLKRLHLRLKRLSRGWVKDLAQRVSTLRSLVRITELNRTQQQGHTEAADRTLTRNPTHILGRSAVLPLDVL